MVITKNSDGTTSYSGITVPTVDCFAQALDLKYKKKSIRIAEWLKKGFYSLQSWICYIETE